MTRIQELERELQALKSGVEVVESASKVTQAQIDHVIEHYGAKDKASALEQITNATGRNNLKIIIDEVKGIWAITGKLDQVTGKTEKGHDRIASTHGSFGYVYKGQQRYIGLNHYGLDDAILAAKKAKKAAKDTAKIGKALETVKASGIDMEKLAQLLNS